MKLLTKSDQTKAKALEKNREIQEGLKLAKRVDALREISAQEDKALKDFRKNTLAEISKEIEKEAQKRDELIQEVKILEDRKIEALKPLESEWDKVNMAKEETTRKEEAILSQIEGIKTESEDIQRRIKEISNKEANLNTLISITHDKHEVADLLLKEAKKQSNFATQVLDNAKIEASGLINNAKEKESYIINREKAIFKKEEELRKKEIELAKQESALRDKYATLERSINRLKK